MEDRSIHYVFATLATLPLLAGVLLFSPLQTANAQSGDCPGQHVICGIECIPVEGGFDCQPVYGQTDLDL